jgi:hypothetical protein
MHSTREFGTTLLRSTLLLGCFVGSFCAVFGQTPDCGRAPENITEFSQFKSLWKKHLCTSQNIKAGAKIPIDNIPFGVDFSDAEASCTDEDKQETTVSLKLQQYLADHQSLRLAECGYRACQLKRAGTSDVALESYYSVCGGAPGTMTAGSTVRLKKTLYSLVVTPEEVGKKKDITLTVVGSQDADLMYKFTGLKEVVANPTTGTIPAKGEAIIPVSVTVPKVQRGQPEYLNYFVTVTGAGNARRILSGYFVLSRIVTSECSMWVNDNCAICKIPVSWNNYAPGTVQTYSCEDMPPNTDVTAKFTGTAIVTTLEDRKIWNNQIAIHLNMPGQTCPQPGPPWVASECFGVHYGGDSWTEMNLQKRGKTSSTGRAEANLGLVWCITGDDQRVKAKCGTEWGSTLVFTAFDKNSMDSVAAHDALTKKSLQEVSNRLKSLSQ